MKQQSNVTYQVVTDSDPNIRFFIDGFKAVYREAFGRPPYNEQYSDEVLQEIWDLHQAPKACTILATTEGSVVGLGCYHWTFDENDPSISQFLKDSSDRFPKDLSSAIYMSEVAVLSSKEGQGIGSSLVKERMIQAQAEGFSYYVMRTAHEDSNSFGMYTGKFGAIQVPNLFQEVSEIETASSHRLWLYGTISEALEKVNKDK